MSLFDLSFAVTMLATEIVTVVRYTDGYDSNGDALPRNMAQVQYARASFQPISGADLERFAEGNNGSTLVSVWFTASAAIGDELQCNGLRYQIEHIDDWSSGGNYTKAIARKLDARET